MTTVEVAQLISLSVSIITVVALIILAHIRRRAWVFYTLMILGWVPGIIYYTGVLFFYDEFLNFFKVPALDASAMLRVYQYCVFGTWFVVESCYAMYEYNRDKEDREKYQEALKKLNETAKKIHV